MQILKLGLSGSETTLETKSRINNQGQDTFNVTTGTSADGTLSADFSSSKRNYEVSWDILSQDNYDILYNLYKDQFTGSFLNYIYTDQDGTETTVEVLMQPPSKGTLIQQDIYYYSSVSITLQET